jgi:2-keto-3-deoxy-L-rhamnonate aldolase RhmA
VGELKKRLRAGQQLMGIMVTTLCHVDLPKLLHKYGYDFFMIDMEHGSFSLPQAASMISVARGIGMPALVRIPELRREWVLKVLEMGAEGLLLPDTKTSAQAAEMVRYGKYAPMGERGVSMSRPHTDYQKVDALQYMRQANEDTLLLCQIESRTGVGNIHEILSVEGIDGAIIGPNDLSQDYGMLGQYDAPPLREAFHRVMEAARQTGKFSGVHFASAEKEKVWVEAGMQLNMCNSDIGLMAAGARLDLALVKGGNA